MRILAVLNLSNTDDPMCDSGVIFQRVLAPEFQAMGVDYHLALPDHPSLRMLAMPGATLHFVHMGTTRYASRFGFAYDAFSNLLDLKFDVIFNNQVELTGAIRSILATTGRAQTALVTYCHYPALYPAPQSSICPDPSLDHQNLGLPIVMNVLMALHVADRFLTQSNFAKHLIENAASYFNIIPRSHAGNPISVIAPPADPQVSGLPTGRNSRVVVYNHRLYQSYGTKELLDFADGLQDLGVRFWVSDPMSRRSAARSKLTNMPEVFRRRITAMPHATLFDGNVGREVYTARLAQSCFALAPWRRACVWSMAAMDCMGLGVPVIAPRYAAYPELVPGALLFDSPNDAWVLAQRLLNDKQFWAEESAACLEVAHRFRPPVVARKFYRVFREALAEREKNVSACVG